MLTNDEGRRTKDECCTPFNLRPSLCLSCAHSSFSRSVAGVNSATSHPLAAHRVSYPARPVSSAAPGPRAACYPAHPAHVPRVIQRIQPTCRVLSSASSPTCRVSSRAPDLLAWRVIQSAQPPLLNALCNEREGSPPKTPQALTTANESDRRSFALIAVAFGLIGLGALDDTRRARRSGALDDTRHARRSGALDDTPREGWVLWMTRGAWGRQRGVADRLCDPPDSKRQE